MCRQCADAPSKGEPKSLAHVTSHKQPMGSPPVNDNSVMNEMNVIKATVPVAIEKARINARLRNLRELRPNKGRMTPDTNEPPPIPRNPVLKENMLETSDVSNIATRSCPSVDTRPRIPVDEDSVRPKPRRSLRDSACEYAVDIRCSRWLVSGYIAGGVVEIRGGARWGGVKLRNCRSHVSLAPSRSYPPRFPQ